MHRRPLSLFALSVLLFGASCLTWPAPAQAYVDLAPTLAKVIRESQRIVEIEVVKFSAEDKALVAKELRALKGTVTADLVRHRVGSATAGVPRQLITWANPGSRGVMFVAGNSSLVCVGSGWYQVAKSGGGWWTIGADRPDLPLAYYGAVSHLTSAIELMLAGKDAVITVVRHGGNDEAASFDLALNRTALPALVSVERIRANMKMPMVAMAVPGADYLIGMGQVDEKDIPDRIAQLQSTDATARAEAADDLRWLGPKASAAIAALTPLLNDPSPRVRASAAAALLRIKPSDGTPLNVLRHGLKSGDAAERSSAADASGTAGPAAGALAPELAALLADPKDPARLPALLAISTLGPAARSAAPAVIPLLDDPQLTIDAADALGHLGTSARPALKQLADLLKSADPAVRWAAVRSMSQIGSEEAHPAVEFMLHALPEASEVEGYNMMIYLALLGPVARDAIPTLRTIRIKNPVLPTATLWAIEPDKGFPWQPRADARPEGPGAGRGGFGGGAGEFGGRPGGPGGFGGGDDEGPEFARYIYESYVHELGARLQPAAVELAKQILSGKAGNIPQWGYQILTCGTDPALDLLTPHLADSDQVSRERAAVALGYMGPVAARAKPAVANAIEQTNDEQEKHLLSWCLKALSGRPGDPSERS